MEPVQILGFPAELTLPTEFLLVAAFLAAFSLLSLPPVKGLLIVVWSFLFWWLLARKARMEVKASELLKVFQATDGSVATKVGYLNDIKGDIKHKSVPEAAIPAVFEVIRRAIASANSQQLMLTGFSTLSNFLKRLYGQGQANVIGFHGHKLFYPLLTEKLADQWVDVREAASRAFADFWVYSLPEARFEIEHNVIQNVLSGKSSRAKVVSLQWLSDMVKNNNLKFRSYVPLLINNLEDADGAVRDTAKATVIQLFKGTSGRAIADLTKQLRLRGVRKIIAEAILLEVSGSHQEPEDLTSSVISVASPSSTMEASLPARPHTRAELQRPNSVMSSRQQSRPDTSHTVSAAKSQNADLEVTSAQGSEAMDKIQIQKRLNRSKHHTHTQSNPEAGPEPSSSKSHSVLKTSTLATESDFAAVKIKTNDAGIEPMFVETSKQLDELIMSTRVHFDGRETEHNWTKREESITLLRRITKGNGPNEYRVTYCGAMYIMVEGILKAVNSLRTTLSTTGCELIQETCKVVGHGIDPFAEILLQDLIKLCAGTKKISANNGNVTVDAVFAVATITHRIVNHIWQACQDKNVSPRLFAAGWLKTLMKSHRQGCNKSGCMDLIEKSIRKGLEDANPGVRTNMRGTYWTFAEYWPEKAQSIMSSLDAKSQNLLQQDPSNPKLGPAPHNKTTASKQDNGPPRPRPKSSLKDAIAAQKKMHQTSKAADDLPSRPASAMSSISELKAPGKVAVRPAPVLAPSVSLSHSAMQSGSLSSAPMRPPVRPAAPRKPEAARTTAAEAPRRAEQEVESVTITTMAPNMTASVERPTSKHSMTSPEKPFSKSSVNSPENQLPKTTVTKKIPTSPSRPKRFPAATTVGSTVRPKSQPFDVSNGASAAAVVPEPSRSKFDDGLTQPSTTLSRSRNGSVTTKERTDEEIETPKTRKNRTEFVDSIPNTSVSGKLRPVKRHSPQNSDDLSQTAETVRVYEDPHVSTQTMDAVGADHTVSRAALVPPANVLEDVSINQQNENPPKLPPPVTLPQEVLPESPLRGQGKPNAHDTKLSQRRWEKAELAQAPPVGPRSKDRTLNQQTLRRYIEGIRNRTIDVMGFRKLQGIIIEHDAIFDDEVLFDEMLLSLCGLLETPNDVPRQFLGRTHDQKQSALTTVRIIIEQQPKYIQTYYARVLSALIVGRQYFDNASHIVTGFDQLSKRIVSESQTSWIIDAILDILTVLENNEATDRSMIMGSHILVDLLTREETDIDVSSYEDRLADVTRNGFGRSRAAVRRAMVDYVKVLKNIITPESRLYAKVAGSSQDLKYTLTYYLNV